MAQRVESDKTLDFLCQHGNAYVLYEKEGIEYIIEMILPIKENGGNILRWFGQNADDRYRYVYNFSEYDVQEYASRRYVSIFKVKNQPNGISLEKQTNSKKLLKDFYDRYYSVNRLVQTASGSEINTFIFDLLFENKELSQPSDAIRARTKSGILRTVQSLNSIYEKRAREVDNVIQSFNKSQDGKLRIKYSNDEIIDEPNFSEWVFGRKSNERNYFKGYNIN